MSSFNGLPTYWKRFLYDIPAMVKQLGITTYFLTLPCAELRREELPYIIIKLNNFGLSEREIKKFDLSAKV